MKHLTSYGSEGFSLRAVLGTLLSGVEALLVVIHWTYRLMPRSVGGDGLYAWTEAVRRARRAVR